ncbi:uracil phosphoribosyltransferase [Candidatus Hydrogenisulfobacillus filiaventi]|uniref:Uracil phosphoribosyltransferase n=1 Tax=Candidatus Hydrogenisulfobacillus filiaventi TaxID=2707344 RepID=A0A6F8ZEF5_9FIRM|nr:uracil phosphoribosyltransferase [Bacillota bacterium]CAB1128135.1 uracil phosphoribosyltransferase [Candidatus Hydrogenisulfobacillus filiaventi]
MLTVIHHPLTRVHLTRLRDRATDAEAFARHLRLLARLLAFPALQGLTVNPVEVETPLGRAEGAELAVAPVLVPILRAGLGLVDGFRDVCPEARVWHLGLYRDHATLSPVPYYTAPGRLDAGTPAILLDPMLATGGSLTYAIGYLKQAGVRQLAAVSVIAAPEGVAAVERAHPDVPLYTCAVDRGLDERGYILPGLGDAGDRQFGTW